MFDFIGKWFMQRVVAATVKEADRRGVALFSEAHGRIVKDWLDQKEAKLKGKAATRLHGLVDWMRKKWGDSIQTDEQMDKFIDAALHELPESELKIQARLLAARLVDKLANTQDNWSLWNKRSELVSEAEELLALLGGGNGTGDRAKL